MENEPIEINEIMIIPVAITTRRINLFPNLIDIGVFQVRPNSLLNFKHSLLYIIIISWSVHTRNNNFLTVDIK